MAAFGCSLREWSSVFAKRYYGVFGKATVWLSSTCTVTLCCVVRWLQLDLIETPGAMSIIVCQYGSAVTVSTALVVDDSEPFRRFICSTLESRPNLKIISQASDGLEAVEKAQVLKPDLILLDIGLPSLNGIEAAHRISRLIPTAKILFVSQISDADVVQEALSNGAIGYVWKQDAGIALLPAVEAALRGTHFVSSGIQAANPRETEEDYSNGQFPAQ